MRSELPQKRNLRAGGLVWIPLLLSVFLSGCGGDSTPGGPPPTHVTTTLDTTNATTVANELIAALSNPTAPFPTTLQAILTGYSNALTPDETKAIDTGPIPVMQLIEQLVTVFQSGQVTPAQINGIVSQLPTASQVTMNIDNFTAGLSRPVSGSDLIQFTPQKILFAEIQLTLQVLVDSGGVDKLISAAQNSSCVMITQSQYTLMVTARMAQLARDLANNEQLALNEVEALIGEIVDLNTLFSGGKVNDSQVLSILLENEEVVKFIVLQLGANDYQAITAYDDDIKVYQQELNAHCQGSFTP